MFLLWSAAALAASVELNPGDDVGTLTGSLGPGDVVSFSPGTYPIESYLDWTGAGTEAEPIQLVARGGEVVLEFSGSYEVAYLHDASWIEVRGLTFRITADNANGPYAFYLANTDHVTVTDCVFGPAGRGVYVDGNNTALTFDNNEIRDAADGHGLYIGCSDASCWTQDSSFSGNWIHDIASTYGYLLYLANGGQNNTIADNVLYGTPYRGLAVNSTEYGEPNVVNGNAIWNAGEIGMLVRGPSIVQNNIVFNVGGHGIYSGDNDRGTLEHASISHNTVFGSSGWGIYVEHWAGKTGMVLANNVVANTTGYGMYVTDGGIDADNYISHNVVSGLVDNMELYVGTDTPIIPGGGDADFVDPVSWNFYPASGSVLLAAGDPSSAAFVPPDDFNGVLRNGEAPDAGAYERAGENNPGWVIAEGFKDTSDVDAYTGSDVGGGCCGGKGSDEEAAAMVPLLLLVAGAARRRKVRR